MSSERTDGILSLATQAGVLRTNAAPTRRGDLWLVVLVVVVVLGVSGAMAAIWRYKNTAGAQEAGPGRWPDESAIPRDSDRPTLLLFAHPRCACSRASLAELRTITSEFRDRVSFIVVFALPEGAAEEWRRSDIWESAASMRGVQVFADRNNVETTRFRAKTSGQAFLYAANGELLFQGGITSSRGHLGDNVGQARVLSLLRNQTTGRASTPVFGCQLDNQAGKP